MYSVYFMRGRDHPNVLNAAKTFTRDHAHLLTSTRVPGVIDPWHYDNAGEFIDGKVEAWAAAMGTQLTEGDAGIPRPTLSRTAY